MKSQKIIELWKELTLITGATGVIKLFALSLIALFFACIGSIIGLSLTSPYNDILTLAKPEFHVTTLILTSTIIVFVGNLLYCYLKRSKAQRLGVAVVSVPLNLFLLFITISLVLNEFFFPQVPTIDVFKWGSAVILGYNIFLPFTSLGLTASAQKTHRV